MKNILLSLFLIPFLGLSQVQIGQDIDGEAAGDNSGYGLAISNNGSIIAIGATANNGGSPLSGHVRVYENQSNVWTQIGQDIDGENSGDYYGWSVSLSDNGNIIAIGGFGHDGNGNNSGYVQVYENILGVWTKIGQDIDGENLGDHSGSSISLSGNGSIVAIGSHLNSDNGNASGQVRIYENISGVWTKIGQNINGEHSEDTSGWSISLSNDGSTVAIGERGNDDNGIKSGQARIFKNINGVWTQIGQDINGSYDYGRLGWSISLSGDGSIVAVGAIFNGGSGLNTGYTRIYNNLNGVWTQIGQDIDGEAAGDFSGESISLSDDGNIIAIGGSGNSGNGIESGYTRIFQNQNSLWTQIGVNIEGEAEGDWSGEKVSLSSNGNTVAIGAIYNDGNGDNSGHVRVFDLTSTLSINEDLINNISIHPNPTSTILNIELTNPSELKKVTIYNNLGQLITEETKNKINVSNYSKGIYFAEIKTTKGKSTKKFIIE